MTTRDTSIQISHSGPGVLSIKKRRSAALAGLIPAVVFVAAFYYVLPGTGETRAHGYLAAMDTWLDRTWLNWIILFLPLVALPKLKDTLRVLRHGDVFTFDHNTREIRRNGKLLASFDDVRALGIATVNGSCEELSVSLHRHQGRPHALHTCASFTSATELAEAVSRQLGVDVVRDL